MKGFVELRLILKVDADDVVDADYKTTELDEFIKVLIDDSFSGHIEHHLTGRDTTERKEGVELGNPF